MTHVPFTSRLASLIGLPSNPSPKYDDGSDEYYIPYTGTYEPPPPPPPRNPTPPAGTVGGGGRGVGGVGGGGPSSSSTHTYVRTNTHSHTHTHAHTHSGSTKVSNTQGSSSYSGHPYNPDRFFAHVQQQPSSSSGPHTHTYHYPVEESDRGRKPPPRRISNSSSFAALALPSEHHGTGLAFPKHPPSTSTVQPHPHPHTRRGGPSFLALDGGFIGHSPVAAVPPPSLLRPSESHRESRERERERERESSGKSERTDRSAHRSSFASFITFGNSRKSIAPASASSGHGQVHGHGHGHGYGGPHSASATSFPHSAARIRGERRPSAVEYEYYDTGEEGGGESGEDKAMFFSRLPPIPPYMRQRSRSYVDQTEQQQQGEIHPHSGGATAAGRNSVKVTMPTSFFDVEEREGIMTHPSSSGAQKLWSNHGQATSSTTAPPHPYHRHYHPATTEPPRDMHGNIIDLNSPTAPSFDFLHPYATAPAPVSTNTSPSKVSKSRHHHTLGMRPLVIPRKPVPDFHEREHDSDRERDHRDHYHRHRDRDRERERPSPGVFPFVNPFSFANPVVYTPPTTRPVTPKGRLKSLVSLGEGLRTLKGSISTPNLRAAAAAKAHSQPQPPVTGGGGTQLSHSTRQGGTAVPSAEVTRRPSSSRTVPPNSILQGQTLCDTFFLPRPRFHAHQISPPDSPHSPIVIREPKAPPRQQHRTQAKPNAGEVAVALREWNRRPTTAGAAVMTRSDPGAEQRERERREMQRLGKKKASAPDLRRRPEKLERRLTEAEKVLLRGEEQDREREEWQRTAQGSFQNRRSRSLSRTRTKSIAKGSTSAATSGDEREKEKVRPSKRSAAAAAAALSSVAVTVTVTTNPGTAPPTATSSSGPATSGDESRSNPRERETQRFKTSMEYLASRAFSQGHTSVAPAPGPSSSGHSHSRHHSGDTSRDRHQRDKSKNQSLSHRRSESWSRTALRLAQNSCADPNATSPAIDTIYQPGIDDAPQVVVVGTKLSHDDTVLDIGPNKLDDRPPSDDLHWRPSAIGIAIGTPPLDSLLNEASHRIDHPYNSPIPSPIFVGPHPTSPINPLPSLPMSDVVSRHRLPPRAHTAFSPPRSPDGGIAGLDAYVPTMEGSSPAVLSRESWLVYMNALEEGETRPRPIDKGKGRAVEAGPIIYEDRPTRDVPEDVDVSMDTPELQLDLGLDGSPVKSMRSRIISAHDMEAQLTKAFRRQSAASMSGSSENEHSALTFEAGATLSRLLSSRSVTSTPRSGSMRRKLSNPGTPKVKKTTMIDPDDPQSTLTQTTSTRPPIPIFEPMTHHRSSSGGASRRISAHSDAAVSGSGQESLWRKSILSSEVAAHSPPSQESSPKASPRTLVNLDDLEGYSDLFYAGGHGSFNGRPKSGGSSKTNTSSGLLERALRPEMVTFGSKGNGASSGAERSRPTSDPARAAAGGSWSSGGLSPPPPKAPSRIPPVVSPEPPWGASGPTTPTVAELERTWDPEEDEEEEDSYRIGDTRQPIVVRATLPVHRHSTKLSVIEGSVDEHATASESTADPEDQESMPATSPTRATIPGAPHDQALEYPPLVIDTLAIPQVVPRRTSSEAVVPDEYARTSMITNTSGQSRMSGLSDFPVPPIESAAFALTPSDLIQSYPSPRALSPVPPASPASVLSVEPPSPVAEPDEGDDQSVSEHHPAFSALAMASTPVREYRSNRATFGPDTDIARQWTERGHSSPPTSEED